MPELPERRHGYPSETHTLARAAAAGEIVVVRCGNCRKVVNYLAADLAELLGPQRNAFEPHFACGTCRTEMHLRIKMRAPQPGDVGSLIVRRPAGVRTTRLWRDVPLGD